MLDIKLLKELEDYVQGHSEIVSMNLYSDFSIDEKEILDEVYSNEIEDFIKNNRKPTFQEVLFSYIDEKGVADAEIYKKAGIDRRHFSKIRSNPNYRIGKNTVIALALALELKIEDTDSLLSSAGYSLSESDTHDLVIQFCLEKRIFNIHDVNQALDYFSLKPLT
jgi:hypothetical protein